MKDGQIQSVSRDGLEIPKRHNATVNQMSGAGTDTKQHTVYTTSPLPLNYPGDESLAFFTTCRYVQYCIYVVYHPLNTTPR